ncbi:hypothetical protein ACLI4Y_16605 [Natrialbaceae archaeon A-CW3]
MVDKEGVKLALLVGGVALLALVGGQLLRRVTWMLSWAVLVLTILVITYVAYELYTGWSAGADNQQRRQRNRNETTAVSGRDTIDELKDDYAADELSDEEFEAELERLVEDEPNCERDVEHEIR